MSYNKYFLFLPYLIYSYTKNVSKKNIKKLLIIITVHGIMITVMTYNKKYKVYEQLGWFSYGRFERLGLHLLYYVIAYFL